MLNSRLGLPKRSVFKDLEVVREGGKYSVRYKGQSYSGAEGSPVLARLLARPAVEERISESIFGPAPNSFVGEFGYPSVMAGPLVSVGDAPAAFADSPASWTALDYAEIVEMRSFMVRGKRKLGVKDVGSRYAVDLKDAVLSTKPVDVEVDFQRRPSFSLFFSPVAQPSGPSGMVSRFGLAGNPVVPNQVDEILEEKLKVAEAVPELLGKGVDYYYIQRLLSAGALGVDRKLVPTKWSITAADDVIAKNLMEQVRRFPEVSGFLVFSNEFLHNRFEILLIPGKWEFEQFEAWGDAPWAGMGDIAEEYEPFGGRSDYAEREGGGYYAGRLGCVEALHSMRRQARVVVFREIGGGYEVPVGVWQVRENVRQAFKKPPLRFSTLAEALAHLKGRLRNPVEAYVRQSRVLSQKRLSEFF